MNRWILLCVCITLFIPLRLAMSLCDRTSKNAETVAEKVGDAVSSRVRKAKRSMTLNARVAAQTLKSGLSDCVETGIKNVKCIAGHMPSARSAEAGAGKGKSSKGKGGSVPFHAYVDLSILVAVIMLFKRGKKRS